MLTVLNIVKKLKHILVFFKTNLKSKSELLIVHFYFFINYYLLAVKAAIVM